MSLKRPESSDPRDVADFVDSRVDEMEERISQHFDRRFAELTAMFRSAFPDDDPVQHRKAHDLMIEAAKEEAEFWQELKKHLAKGTAWSLLVALAGAAYVGVQIWIKGLK